MKTDIHPTLKKVKFVCNCGESGDYVCEAYSTIQKDVIKVEVCSYCHPFYTGKQRIVDSGGRVEKFMKKMEIAKTAKKAKETPKETHKTEGVQGEEVVSVEMAQTEVQTEQPSLITKQVVGKEKTTKKKPGRPKKKT